MSTTDMNRGAAETPSQTELEKTLSTINIELRNNVSLDGTITIESKLVSALYHAARRAQEAERERDEANKNPAMPGAFKCDKCGFILQKHVLYAGDGSISADTRVGVNECCPNDGQIMRCFTWREANEGFCEDNIKLREQLSSAQEALKLAAEALQEIDKNNYCKTCDDQDHPAVIASKALSHPAIQAILGKEGK